MLVLLEKILQWEFEATNSAPILPGTFAKESDLDDFDREDGPSSGKKTYVVFPKNWQPVVGSSEVLWLFFMVNIHCINIWRGFNVSFFRLILLFKMMIV